MSTNKKETNFIEDMMVGTGKMIGGVLGEAYDATAAVVVGLASTPGAIIDGFNEGLFTDEDEPKSETGEDLSEEKTVQKKPTLNDSVAAMSDEDKAKLRAALDCVPEQPKSEFQA